MDRLLHLDRTLDELDPPRWGPPGPDATRLVAKVHELRRLPLGELGPADLRTLISQQVALAHVVPLAARLLFQDPLLDAYFHEGDLLLAVVSVPASTWDLFPALGARLRTTITTLPEAAVAGLPRGAAEDLGRYVARSGGEPGPPSGGAGKGATGARQAADLRRVGGLA
ncbi:contact-dependent growth inhibition system immunity protein [Streptomyces sp. NPDC004779]